MIVPSPRSAFLKVSNIPTDPPHAGPLHLFSRGNIIVLCPFPAMACHRAERALAGQTDTSPIEFISCVRTSSSRPKPALWAQYELQKIRKIRIDIPKNHGKPSVPSEIFQDCPLS